MAKTVNAKNFQLVVLARTGYGADWFPVYEPAKDDKLNGAKDLDTMQEHCIKYIRAHRQGAQGMEYRIKDTVTGAVLD